MITTIRRRSLCLTKEMEEHLKFLCDKFNENPSQIMARALKVYYQQNNVKDNEK